MGARAHLYCEQCDKEWMEIGSADEEFDPCSCGNYYIELIQVFDEEGDVI